MQHDHPASIQLHDQLLLLFFLICKFFLDRTLPDLNDPGSIRLELCRIYRDHKH